MAIQTINNYLNPWSEGFKEDVRVPLSQMELWKKILIIGVSTILGFATFFVAGAAGTLTCRLFVHLLKKDSSAVVVEEGPNLGVSDLSLSKGSVCITSSNLSGYIGPPGQRQLLPSYYDKLAMPDGEPLLMDPYDFFVEVCFFDVKAAEGLILRDKMYLPASLFQGKIDGDTISLLYEGMRMEFTINQANHALKYQKGSFEEALDLAAIKVETQCSVEQPMFSLYIPPDPFAFYTMGDKGAIYKLQLTEGSFSLEECSKERFRFKKNPVFKHDDFWRENQKLILALGASGYGIGSEKDLDDFDIIVNEESIVILQLEKLREKEVVFSSFSERNNCWEPISSERTIENFLRKNLEDGLIEMDDGLYKQETFFERQHLFHFKWDLDADFFDSSIDQVKDSLENAKVTIQDGLLLLSIPLPEKLEFPELYRDSLKAKKEVFNRQMKKREWVENLTI